MQDFDGKLSAHQPEKGEQVVRREIPRISGPGLDSRTIARPISKNRARKKDFEPGFRDQVERNGGWFVTQRLSCDQQPTAELNVLMPDMATWTGSRVNAKQPVLFKHLFPKRHVGAEGSLAELAWLRTAVEECGQYDKVCGSLRLSQRGGEKDCAKSVRPPHLPIDRG